MTAPADRRALPAIGAAVIVGLIAVAPLFANAFHMHLLNAGGLLAISAMALTVLTGTAGLLSLGQAAFLAIGAFSAGMAANGFMADAGVIPILLWAGLIGMLIGGAIAAITIRAIGIYLAVGTFALHQLVELVLTDIEVKQTGANGFVMPPLTFGSFEFATDQHWWYLIAGLMLLTWWFFRRILRSSVGRAWVATREAHSVAAAMGISQFRVRVGAFMLTSFVTSAAGALSGYYGGVVQVGAFPFHLSIVSLAVVVLGGLGNLTGAILAAYLITILPHALSYALTEAGIDVVSRGAGSENIALGLILILVLLRVGGRIRRRLLPLRPSAEAR
ncbi:MAG: branched-chain amino acid ABC transporter permease [Burkholderiales bacterium]|nr:branched-chain amino acid ABC transporter permease [Burkholderiales bacterium]